MLVQKWYQKETLEEWSSVSEISGTDSNFEDETSSRCESEHTGHGQSYCQSSRRWDPISLSSVSVDRGEYTVSGVSS